MECGDTRGPPGENTRDMVVVGVKKSDRFRRHVVTKGKVSDTWHRGR